MLSDVLRDRLMTMLAVWDANRDGAIEESDYAIAAGRMVSLGGLDPGSAQYAQLHAQLVDGGWALLKQFDADGDGRVTIDEALAGFDGLHADAERYRKVIVEPSYSVFDLIDTDHDGRITAEEHRDFLVTMTVDEAAAASAFAHLDADGDGFLTRDEYVRLMDEFYTSDDPDAAGGWLFGGTPRE